MWPLIQISTSHWKKVFSPILYRGLSSVFCLISPLARFRDFPVYCNTYSPMYFCLSCTKAICLPVSSIVHTDSIESYPGVVFPPSMRMRWYLGSRFKLDWCARVTACLYSSCYWINRFEIFCLRDSTVSLFFEKKKERNIYRVYWNI